MGKWVDGWLDGWVDGKIDGALIVVTFSFSLLYNLLN